MTATTTAARPTTKKATRTNRRGHSLSQRTPGAWLVLMLMMAFAVLTIVPVLLAALNAFKTNADYVENGPLAIPASLSIESLMSFWSYVDFSNKLLNSVLISGGTAILGVLISLLAAYALGIGRVRGRFIVLAVALLTFAMPQEALIYPIYYMLQPLGLYDTQIGVVLILSVLSAAFGTYMLTSVLAAFPKEILEAAQIDGAGRLRTLISVVVPVIAPSLAVLATFFFIWTWNDFFISLILLPSSGNQTVSVSLGVLFGQFTTDPVLAAAAALAGILPTFVFFLLFQRTLMQGVTLGAVK